MTPCETPHRALVETALGNEPADLVIRNGTLVDVYSGRVLKGRSVAVKEKWIAYVGPDADHCAGVGTRVIEADGRILAPGYMETHAHLASYWNLADFLQYAIPGGTTTFITELESVGYAAGAAGIQLFLGQLRNRPVKFYCTIPPLVTFSPAARSRSISPQETRELLREEIVLGLGEAYWQEVVLTPDNRVLELMQEALRAGKSVQGHAAGAFDRKLAAYAASGAMSCHEPITPEDVLSRLELGLYVMVRDGEIRQDLDILLPIRDRIDMRRVILVTDQTNPELLTRNGFLVDVIQKAVDKGLDPVKVIQAVTINPAEHFGLAQITGGIAPSRLADILILPSLGVMQPDTVISEGKVVAENGRACVQIPRVPYPPEFFRSVRVPPVSPADLGIPATGGSPQQSVRTIAIQPGGLVSREGSARPRQEGGILKAAPEEGLLKAVFIERVTGRGERFSGFVQNGGLRAGAVASTLCWEAAGIVAIGSNDEDLSVAINRVIEMQGGSVLSVGGEVREEIPFNVLGCLSELSMGEIASGIARFQRELRNLGSPFDNPHLSLLVLTTAAIPFIRMSEKGYYRYREKDYVGL